jgi:hypothetical protein
VSERAPAPVLDHDQLAELARLVAAELEPQITRAIAELRDAPAQRDKWLSPAATAERFAVTTDWLYRHAAELGVLRLGDGPKARLRFDPRLVEQALIDRSLDNHSSGARSPAPAAQTAPPPPARRGIRSAGVERVPLLPAPAPRRRQV